MRRANTLLTLTRGVLCTSGGSTQWQAAACLTTEASALLQRIQSAAAASTSSPASKRSSPPARPCHCGGDVSTRPPAWPHMPGAARTFTREAARGPPPADAAAPTRALAGPLQPLLLGRRPEFAAAPPPRPWTPPPPPAPSPAPGPRFRRGPPSPADRKGGHAAGRGGAEKELEIQLALRQVVENARLPDAIKRSVFTDVWDETLLNTKRTAKVTKAGRIETYHVIVAVGNFNGLFGLGVASGSNLQQVTLDGYLNAYASLVPIPRYRQHTIYHVIDASHRKVRIQMWPRREGFGMTASPLMRELCEMVGISNITIKVSGRRRNKLRVVRTWLEALQAQSLPHDGVEGSGAYVREILPGKLPYRLQRGVDVP